MIKAGTQEKILRSGFFVFLYKLRKIPPFREYALPLKWERWHAKRAGEGATCQGTSAEPQNDICHVERKYAVQK